MFEHQQILDRIIEIEKILIHLGFEKKNDFPKNWNLDSTMKFTPKNDNFTVNYKNQNRVLMSIDVGIVSGLIFTLSGSYKPNGNIWEQIYTDYFFKDKFHNHQFFVEELRDFKIKLFTNNYVN